METKPLSEITRLKLININLSLKILQLQANQLLLERDSILLEELKNLGCNPEEWMVNDQTWEVVKRSPTEPKAEGV